MFEFLKNIFRKEKSKTILVIDDSEVDRTLAERILSQRHYVLTANSGDDGIRLACEKRPDAILLDFMMPGMNGPEVCRRLRDDERTKTTPIVFLTSMDTPQHLLESFQQEADAFLAKPINPRDLLWQIERALHPPVF
ncbi:MAG: response regulator [Candidatus Omnitrophica bacterium]|nr:response regulator [Candidatus Omnitrophota bacterium]